MKAIRLAAALCTLVVIGCGQRQEQREKTPIRVSTEVIGEVQAAQTSQGHTYVGIIEENEATAVSFTGMGVVRRVHVREGQSVSAGQLLAEMDDTQARNLLEAAQASATQAEDALVRYRQLHEQGSMTEAQWVEVQSKVTQARSQLATARKNLSDCRLTAPVSGIVGRKLVNAGETALPSQAVLTLLDISSVKVRVPIPEAEYGAISGTTPSSISVESAGMNVAGGRIEKGVQADALTHTYDIRVSVANADRRLLPGMVASVSLDPAPAADEEGRCLSLPVTAVQKKVGGEFFVWVVDQDHAAHRVVVRTGRMMGNRIAVTDGLVRGQRVVTEGYQKLSEGTKVAY